MLSILFSAATAQSALSSKIKNVVVLVQENRSFDSIAGGFTYDPSIDGLVGKQFCNPANVTDPNSDIVCADAIVDANDIVKDDPNHSISGTSFGIYSKFVPDEAAIRAGTLKANMNGFVNEQENSYKFKNDDARASAILNYYHPTQVPFMEQLGKDYVLFDQWFCAVPGPTNPNRAYITSGTSQGNGNNNFFNLTFGGMTQRSIFQQLSENNISWINYANTTTKLDQAFYPRGTPNNALAGFNPDSLFYDWTWKSGAVNTNVKTLDKFFADAKSGNLPQFTYINPECCSYDSMHPPSPISHGEQFVKSVYDALVSSPQWKDTLFILTFDEAGGFGDHVPPPVNVPAGDNLVYQEKVFLTGETATFDFTRLGVRVPTYLISPWVDAGVVEHQGKNNGGVYTHTSIIKFLKNLWNLDADLTPRSAWSSTFEHLFRDTPRGAGNPATTTTSSSPVQIQTSAAGKAEQSTAASPVQTSVVLASTTAAAQQTGVSGGDNSKNGNSPSYNPNGQGSDYSYPKVTDSQKPVLNSASGYSFAAFIIFFLAL
ncbi:hypothetical protein HDV06_003953 [Boothiomyces sp. JEL0866]|nr:hypothetical protein HDV06_003953 [Boothiomyces sp. JEL0866]